MEINWLVILATAASGFVLGVVWYAPKVYGKAVVQALGKTPEQLAKPLFRLLFSALASLGSAFGLGVVFAALRVHDLAAQSLAGAIIAGFFAFLWVALTTLSDYVLCNYPLKAFFIQAGYRLLSFVLMGAVMGSFAVDVIQLAR